jgi:hypothetical protein
LGFSGSLTHWKPMPTVPALVLCYRIFFDIALLTWHKLVPLVEDIFPEELRDVIRGVILLWLEFDNLRLDCMKD